MFITGLFVYIHIVDIVTIFIGVIFVKKIITTLLKLKETTVFYSNFIE